MPEYRVDADALEAVASSVSAAADSAPPALVPPIDDCGSSAVATAFSEAGDAFSTAFTNATEEAFALGVGAVTAAQVYRSTEHDVTTSAKDARR